MTLQDELSLTEELGLSLNELANAKHAEMRRDSAGESQESAEIAGLPKDAGDWDVDHVQIWAKSNKY